MTYKRALEIQKAEEKLARHRAKHGRDAYRGPRKPGPEKKKIKINPEDYLEKVVTPRFRGFLGVRPGSEIKGKLHFHAVWNYRGLLKTIGRGYATPEAAALAYDAKVTETWGAQAITNRSMGNFSEAFLHEREELLKRRLKRSQNRTVKKYL